MLVFGGAAEESGGWDVLAIGGWVPLGGFAEACAGWWRRWRAGQCGLALTDRVLEPIEGAYGACGSARRRANAWSSASPQAQLRGRWRRRRRAWRVSRPATWRSR